MLDRFDAFVAGITACYKHIQRIKNLEMTELGLKGTHVMCLFHLHRFPEGLTAARLCQLCDEDKAAVSRTLAELERLGYVRTSPQPGKKYRAPVCLTESGESAARRIDGLIENWVAAGGAGLTVEERQEFYRCLERIASNLILKFNKKL